MGENRQYLREGRMRGLVCASLLGLAATLAEGAPIYARREVLRSTWNRESTQPAAHGFSRKHDSSWDLRGRRANPPLPDPSVAQKPLAPLSATDPVVRKDSSHRPGVADSAGNPVSDLPPWDFTLLDNGQPAKIRTVQQISRAVRTNARADLRPRSINLSPQQLTQTESAIVHFLRRNSGRQETACFLYRLTRDGLFSSSKPTRRWKSAGQRGGAAQVSANSVEIGPK